MPFIKSESELSNLIATIGRINDACAQQSVAAAWLLGQVKEFSESLDCYIAAGNEPSEMLWTIHFCKSLATATTQQLSGVLVEGWETMKEIVTYITAITETLGEPHYGTSVSAAWSGFIVEQLCFNVFGLE